jgi:threo-3-hydroxy-L-aspartate ammonia-lyase
MKLAIDFEDVAQASTRIQGIAHRTPVMRSRTADTVSGAQLFFKETLNKSTPNEASAL